MLLSTHSGRGKLWELLGDEVGAAKDLETAVRLSVVKLETYKFV